MTDNMDYIDLVSEHINHIKTCKNIQQKINFNVDDYPYYTINNHVIDDRLTNLIKQHATTEYKVSYFVHAIIMEGICQNDKLLESNINPHMDTGVVTYDGNTTFKEFYNEWNNNIMYKLYDYYSELYGETSIYFRKILLCILMPSSYLIVQINKLLPSDVKLGSFICEYMHDILYK